MRRIHGAEVGCTECGHVPGAEPAAPASSWAPLDLRRYLNGDDQAERPSVLRLRSGQPILYAGKVNTLVGEPESVKSWVAQEACRQELEAGRSVVYIDFDDSARSVVHRLLALGVPAETILERFHYIAPAERVAAGWPELDFLLQVEPSLVIMDGVTDAMTLEGLSLTDNADVATWYRMLPRYVAERGPAVLLLDHVTKSKEGRGRWGIGGQQKLAGVTGAALGIDMKVPFGRGKVGHAKLFLNKDRHGFIPWEGKSRVVAEVDAISREDGSVSLVLNQAVAAEEFRPTYLMEKISIVLETGGPMSWNKVRETVKKGSNDHKLMALNLLVDEEYVERQDGKRNSKQHTSIRPYRQEMDAGQVDHE